jgi:predicted amidohydrolase YtcJ
MLVRDGLIRALGSMADVERVLASELQLGAEPALLPDTASDTVFHDLEGAFVMPVSQILQFSYRYRLRFHPLGTERSAFCDSPPPQAFVDAHTHVIPGGLALSRVNLRSVRSPEEFRRRVAEGAAALGPHAWQLGGLWDESEWGGQLPNRQWLDEVGLSLFHGCN